MRAIFMFLSVCILLIGCVPDSKKGEKEQVATDAVVDDEQLERVEISIEELVEESGFESFFVGRCDDLVVDFTSFYSNETDVKPTILGYCHSDYTSVPDIDASPTIAIGKYDEEMEEWNVQVVSDELAIHLEEEIGHLEVGKGQYGIVFRRMESKAVFGMTEVVLIYEQGDEFVLEMASSNVVQYPSITITGNVIEMKDQQVKESFAFKNGAFTREQSVEEVKADADVTILINEDQNGHLVGSFPYGSRIPVVPGDRILIKRESAVALANFQVRTDAHWIDQALGLLEIREEDIGTLIEIGNYPFDDMIEYTLGEPERSKFGASFLTKEFYRTLSDKKMPGSPADFSVGRDGLYQLLGMPDGESGREGHQLLRYGEYDYAVSFPDMDSSNDIHSIYREVPLSDGIMGTEVVEAWGKPSEEYIVDGSEGTGYQYDEYGGSGIVALLYHDVRATVYVVGPSVDSLVTAIELWN